MTPEELAAILARHREREGWCEYCSSERVFQPWPCDAYRVASAFLEALSVERLAEALRDVRLRRDRPRCADGFKWEATALRAALLPEKPGIKCSRCGGTVADWTDHLVTCSPIPAR